MNILKKEKQRKLGIQFFMLYISVTVLNDDPRGNP